MSRPGIRLPHGQRLFSFAVMGDTHIEPEPTSGPAPRSNERARRVVAMINRQKPAFVVHLGDVTHPVPSMTSHGDAVTAAGAILSGLNAPLHLTAGNHDVGDKPLAWMPAKTVREAWVEQFHETFQRSWQAFSRDGVRFVLLNAPLLNSGTALEAGQKRWLESEFSSNDGHRLVVLTHYPLYMADAGEPGSYDNIDEPARTWLLDLLERHGAEALFAGHVHNLFYERRGGTEFYIAPATGFVRRDYSEMFRVAPDEDFEFGRNDPEKLGFFYVEMFEHGHRVTFVSLAEDVIGAPSALGVELRHPWCEIVELPFNAPTDVFQRRRVRNDYPVWALWRLGIDIVRVPLADFSGQPTARRLGYLRDRGMRIIAVSYDVPGDDAALDLAEAIEIVLPVGEVLEREGKIARLRQRFAGRVLLAPLVTSQGSPGGGSNMSHFVGAGLPVSALSSISLGGNFDGLVLVALWDDDLEVAVQAAARFSTDHARAIHLTVCLAPRTPDGSNRDDAAIAHHVARAAKLARQHPGLTLILDTFIDIDRGYHVRHGLIDRRCNLRSAARVLAEPKLILAGDAHIV